LDSRLAGIAQFSTVQLALIGLCGPLALMRATFNKTPTFQGRSLPNVLYFGNRSPKMFAANQWEDTKKKGISKKWHSEWATLFRLTACLRTWPRCGRWGPSFRFLSSL